MKFRISLWHITVAALAVLAFIFFFCLMGYSTLGLVCLGLIFLLVFYRVMARLRKKYPKTIKAVVRIFTAILCIGLVIFGITEAIIIRASFGNPEESADYLVVLGAKVNKNGPSLALRNRIDAAYNYLTAHPDCTAILSGGQGADEPITEAQCMFDELVKRGIAPDRLWLEDKSTSTWENLKFTLTVIEEKTGVRPGKIALLSSEFHLFRAGLFAERFGLETVGVPAETSLFFLKVNYFIREAVAIWHYYLIGGNHYA
ncbi:MAG: YdcF family protein [Oscillospiraceae bacterium]|nr:YdcF family protein [Oscillospiraceae bacterium]